MAGNPERELFPTKEGAEGKTGDIALESDDNLADEVAKVSISEKVRQWSDRDGHHKAYPLGGNNVYEVIDNDKTHTKTEISRDMMGRETGRRITRNGETTAVVDDGFDKATIVHRRDGSVTVTKKGFDGSVEVVEGEERNDWLEREREEFKPPTLSGPKARG